jgi:hypothetical protein
MDNIIRIRGKWNIKNSGCYDNNRDFPGLLTIKPYYHAVLECSLSSQGSDENDAVLWNVFPEGSDHCAINRITLISGRGVSGTEITLLNNRMVHRERMNPVSGFETDDNDILFLPEIVIDGYNFSSHDEVRFCRVLTVPDDFVNWIGFEHISGEINKKGGLIIYSAGNCTLKICTDENSPDLILLAEYSEEKRLRDIISDLQVIQNILTFFWGKPSFFVSIKGEHEKNPLLSDYCGEKILNKCSIYLNNNRLCNRKLAEYMRYGSFLISFDEINDDLREYLGRWRVFGRNYSPMVKLYFSVVFNPEMYPENVFLSFTECIEIYHRRNENFKDYLISPDEYRERTDKVKRLLGENKVFTKKVRESIINTLKFGNKPNLENRLNDICDFFGEFLEPYIADFGEFSSYVSVNRNYIAHREAKEDFSYADGNELCIYIAKLEMIIYTIFLSECGFDRDFIKDILGRFMGRKTGECF